MSIQPIGNIDRQLSDACRCFPMGWKPRGRGCLRPLAVPMRRSSPSPSCWTSPCRGEQDTITITCYYILPASGFKSLCARHFQCDGPGKIPCVVDRSGSGAPCPCSSDNNIMPHFPNGDKKKVLPLWLAPVTVTQIKTSIVGFCTVGSLYNYGRMLHGSPGQQLTQFSGLCVLAIHHQHLGLQNPGPSSCLRFRALCVRDPSGSPLGSDAPAKQLSGVCIINLQRTATDVTFSTAASGDADTPEYRLFMQKEGAHG